MNSSAQPSPFWRSVGSVPLSAPGPRDLAHWLVAVSIGVAISLSRLFLYFLSPCAHVVILLQFPAPQYLTMSDKKSQSGPPHQRKPRFTTISGLPVERLYTLSFTPFLRCGILLSVFPVNFPTTAAFIPPCIAARLWTMRQYAGFCTRGRVQSALSVPPEQRPKGSLCCFRSSHANRHGLRSSSRSRRSSEKVGVAIDSQEDMETLFRSNPLEKRFHFHDYQRYSRHPSLPVRCCR